MYTQQERERERVPTIIKRNLDFGLLQPENVMAVGRQHYRQLKLLQLFTRFHVDSPRFFDVPLLSKNFDIVLKVFMTQSVTNFFFILQMLIRYRRTYKSPDCWQRNKSNRLKVGHSAHKIDCDYHLNIIML